MFAIKRLEIKSQPHKAKSAIAHIAFSAAQKKRPRKLDKYPLDFITFVIICQVNKRTMNKFGDLIRAKREEQDMLLRHLSAELDIDTAQLSKIERGERTAKREHVHQLIKIFKLNEAETIALWLADQVYAVVADENEALEALIVAENEVKYQKKLSN